MARPATTFLRLTTFLCQCSFILASTFLAMGLLLNVSRGVVLSISAALLLSPSSLADMPVDPPNNGG